MKFEAHQIDDLNEIARQILMFTKGHKKFAFYGEMGAGKTTLIIAILNALDVEDTTNSPTYAIINEYFSLTFGEIYHFDFYRIEKPYEALDIGVEEIFESDSYSFMEWPEKIGNLLPTDCVEVRITEENGRRIIEVGL